MDVFVRRVMDTSPETLAWFLLENGELVQSLFTKHHGHCWQRNARLSSGGGVSGHVSDDQE